MSLQQGDYARGIDAYLYVSQLGTKVVGVSGGTAKIPATSLTDRAEDKIIIIVKKAATGSAFPAGSKAKDIYIHKGTEVTLAEGDECYIVDKDETYPATTVEGNIQPATAEVRSQKDKGWTKNIRTGAKNFPVTINGFREKGNLLQIAVTGQEMRQATTNKDGAVTFADPVEVVAVVLLNNYDGQTDEDIGLAAAVTFGETPAGWAQDSVQEFTLTCLLSPIANPTQVKVQVA